MIIGLSGKSCAGKNYIAELVGSSWDVINVDEICSRAYTDCHNVLVALFGTADRDTLRNICKNSGFRDAHNKIIHGYINTEIERAVSKFSSNTIVINAALIHNTEIFLKLDLLLVVYAPLWRRLIRAFKRDYPKTSIINILKRFWRQRHLHQEYKKHPCVFFYKNLEDHNDQAKRNTILNHVFNYDI